ncbi:perlucin-like protein [Branchiostoma floridae x Branchiostoma japonicum]
MNYPLPEKGCPNGYEYYQPSQFCYKAFNQPGTYDDAVATCSSEGGTLAMPRDAGINAFLIDLKNAVDDTADFWFGLTDRDQEGRFVWSNGVPLGHFSHWAPGEPNDDGNEDCAHYYPIDYESNRWNDLKCSDPSRSPKLICQVAA